MLFSSNEEGQALTEYSMILVAVALVIILLLVALGGQVLALYTTIADEVGKAVGG